MQPPATVRKESGVLSLRPTPLRREYASKYVPPAKHSNSSLRALAIADVVVTIGLGIIAGMVLLASAFVRGEGMEGMIIGGFLIWMLPHAFFSVMLTVTAKWASIVKCLAIIGLVLNILLMVAFWGSVIITEFIYDNNSKLIPDMIFLIFFKSLKIWAWQALIAPTVIFIASFFERE